MNPIVTKADRLWREVVLWRGDSRCAVCGITGSELECHHIVSRRIRHLRHDPVNGIVLCPWHHAEFAHANARRFVLWLAGNRPAQFEVWQHRRNENRKPDYAAAIARLEAELGT